MVCPACGQRKGRRQCPALGQMICSVCCGTKRLTEINCPDDCSYLASAREHPAAVVRRQQERDVALILPAMENLTERQHQLFFLFHSVVAQHIPQAFTKLVDEDVIEAAGALAATMETAAKGVIYEHTPASLAAQRLVTDLKAMVAEIRQDGTKIYDHEAAVALRAIERAARDTRAVVTGDTAYLTLMSRLMKVPPGTRPAADAEASPRPSLIVP